MLFHLYVSFVLYIRVKQNLLQVGNFFKIKTHRTNGSQRLSTKVKALDLYAAGHNLILHMHPLLNTEQGLIYLSIVRCGSSSTPTFPQKVANGDTVSIIIALCLHASGRLTIPFLCNLSSTIFPLLFFPTCQLEKQFHIFCFVFMLLLPPTFVNWNALVSF